VDPSEKIIASLRAAVAARPDDAALRAHLARLLLDAGQAAAAIDEAARALTADPACAPAREVMLQALEGNNAQADPTPEPAAAPEQPAGDGFDWGAAEDELKDVVAPRLVETAVVDGEAGAYDVERAEVRLADVGGMEEVKQRLEAAFLAPMRNPDLRRLYGKSLRGGLLLYGPPGCGKTFLARAVAGELDAHFLSVGISDVLDMYIGNSERNLHEIFLTARRHAPCVLFFDEVDALGQRRSQTRNSAMRGTVNQLLTELDSVTGGNEGVFVLAATNQPWDVDPALRRPGRFDRTILVLPPDAPARAAILAYHLRDRPVEGIDVDRLVAATDGFSGADLAHLCDTAAERALLESARTGNVRTIGMPDFEEGLATLRPSTAPWFDAARGVALFANEGGAYDELADYLRRSNRL
jgi:AAA+ superfamily predicted ATPase